MKISRDKKKAEAVWRMKSLGIFPDTIRQFERRDLISISEPPLGAFFDLKRIKDFEAEHNALVYMVVRAYYKELGKFDAYLFVGDHLKEWKLRQMRLGGQ